MDSYKYEPISLSGTLATAGSDTVVPLKMASACRCRSGEEGAVNWNTDKNSFNHCNSTKLDKLTSRASQSNTEKPFRRRAA